jgi:hypothetical protein
MSTFNGMAVSSLSPRFVIVTTGDTVPAFPLAGASMLSIARSCSALVGAENAVDVNSPVFVASEADVSGSPEGCVFSIGVVVVRAIPAEAALPKNRAATKIAVNRNMVFTSLSFLIVVCIFIK